MSGKIELLGVFARSDAYLSISDEDAKRTSGTNRKIIAALKKQLRPYKIRILDFKKDDDREQFIETHDVEALPDEYMVTIDALFPMHPQLYRFGKYLINSAGVPCPVYVLITHADAKDGSLTDAKNALAEVWLDENPTLNDYKLEYPVIYCSSDYEHFSLDGKNFEGGIEVLIHYIESTADYWQSRRRGQL